MFLSTRILHAYAGNIKQVESFPTLTICIALLQCTLLHWHGLFGGQFGLLLTSYVCSIRRASAEKPRQRPHEGVFDGFYQLRVGTSETGNNLLLY